MNPETPQPPSSMQSPVWPPAPSGSGSEDPRVGRGVFVSQLKLQRWIFILSAVIALYDLWTMIFGAPGSSGLSLITSIVTMIGGAFELILAILFLVWVHGIYKNLSAFPDVTPSVSPGWAVGYYFVPIISLWRPYQLMDEVWRGSDPQAFLTGQKSGSSTLITCWWLAFIFRSFVNLSSLSNTLNPQQAQLHNAAYEAGQTAAVHSVSLVALILMVLVIRAVNDRQEAKEKLLVETWNSSSITGPTVE